MIKIKNKLLTDEKATRNTYNKFGEIYHKSRKEGKGRLFNEFLDIPATLSLLPDSIKGKCILDAGCGSGFYSRLLSEKGASVTGLDISEKMIEIAREETPKKLNVNYMIGSLYKLPFKNKAFDLILCNYVLENILNIKKVFKEFFRVLKNQGECIISLSHPLRALSKSIKQEERESWILENYYDKGTRLSDFGGGMIVQKYKRTIEDYAKPIKEAGFLISDLLEPVPIREGKIVDPANFEKAMRLPNLLTIKIVKIQ